jgi:hypothetical protein
MKFSCRVTSKIQAEFWSRVLKLESYIDWGQRQLTGPRKQVTMPIVAEFEVDKDLKWIFALCFFIDAIGLQTGFGYVYGCDSDPEDQKLVYEHRDKFANDILNQIEKKTHIDEVLTFPEGREVEELSPPKPHRPPAATETEVDPDL